MLSVDCCSSSSYFDLPSPASSAAGNDLLMLGSATNSNNSNNSNLSLNWCNPTMLGCSGSLDFLLVSPTSASTTTPAADFIVNNSSDDFASYFLSSAFAAAATATNSTTLPSKANELANNAPLSSIKRSTSTSALGACHATAATNSKNDSFASTTTTTSKIEPTAAASAVEDHDDNDDDDDCITDFLNSNSATAIASSLLSHVSSSSNPSSPAASSSPSFASSSKSAIVEMLWKPAKAKKDTFSVIFPEKMMIKPYKYDLLVRSSNKHLIENMSLEMVFADTLEKPSSAKHDILIEKDLMLGSGRLFRFKMYLCSFHFARRDFRLCVVCSGADGVQQRFYSESFRTFARKRETSSVSSCLPTKRDAQTLHSCDKFDAATTPYSSFSSPSPSPAPSENNLHQHLDCVSPAKRFKLVHNNALTALPPQQHVDAATQIRAIFSAMSSEDKVTFAASLFTLLTPEERGRIL